MCKIIVGDGIPAMGQCRNKVRSVVPSITNGFAKSECSLVDKVGNGLSNFT